MVEAELRVQNRDMRNTAQMRKRIGMRDTTRVRDTVRVWNNTARVELWYALWTWAGMRDAAWVQVELSVLVQEEAQAGVWTAVGVQVQIELWIRVELLVLIQTAGEGAAERLHR